MGLYLRRRTRQTAASALSANAASASAPFCGMPTWLTVQMLATLSPRSSSSSSHGSPASFLSHFIVFALAVVIGFYVIGSVHHALHTPLMSVTNAISGIIVVGALLQVTSTNLLIQVIAAAAIFFASINVFGGFTVTNRMLNMFRKG